MKWGNVDLKWLGHAGFCIQASGKRIYIDPLDCKSQGEADIILISHSHFDHCSLPDLEKITKDGTIIILPASAQSTITKLNKKIQMQIVEPGDSLDLGIKIETLPAYNLHKPFHPKSESWLGYLIKTENTIIYHSGDTDLIPEMEKLTGYGKKGNEFIVLLPVGGKYTMDAEDAAKAASLLKPSIAIPMHWGSVIGAQTDAENFVNLCDAQGIKAQILQKE